ncbi:hypothetical protein AB0B45_50430 [Nonomuraea sp. NPDC049152]|uniref:hypothetical protein n=1 Tax=Nonomuraea sp. NPDC049152 TaxID=3154350 RepID=UPI0033FADA72
MELDISGAGIAYERADDDPGVRGHGRSADVRPATFSRVLLAERLIDIDQRLTLVPGNLEVGLERG